MTYKTLHFHAPGRVGAVTFARPDRLNSLNFEVMADLEAVLDRIESEPDMIDALVFTGTGKAFCVGLDLALLDRAFADIAHFEGILRRLNAILHRIEALPLPTIAAVNGYTRAGGLELCLACDFVLIADEAKIGDAHTSAAVMPGGGSTQRLPRRVGEQRAKELIFTARWLDGPEAVAYGLALRSGPLTDLPALVADLVASVTDKPRACLAAVKRAIHAGRNLDVYAGVEAEIKEFVAYTGGYPFAREGYQAFVDKRKPAWATR